MNALSLHRQALMTTDQKLRASFKKQLFILSCFVFLFAPPLSVAIHRISEGPAREDAVLYLLEIPKGETVTILAQSQLMVSKFGFEFSGR